MDIATHSAVAVCPLRITHPASLGGDRLHPVRVRVRRDSGILRLQGVPD